MPFTRTTIYLGEKERRDIKTIQARYGLASLSDGIRLAIRVLASLSVEQGKVVAQIRPRGRKQGEAVLHNQALAAQAKQVSEKARRTLARTETFLSEARARTLRMKNEE